VLLGQSRLIGWNIELCEVELGDVVASEGLDWYHELICFVGFEEILPLCLPSNRVELPHNPQIEGPSLFYAFDDIIGSLVEIPIVDIGYNLEMTGRHCQLRLH
jgi:hypothetical protein